MNTRVVPGFPDYEISDTGVVVSRRRGAPQILRGSPTPSGYTTVLLCRDGEQRREYVHRLVLAAFVGPCPEGMEVCHSDGDPTNNVLGNLRYGTHGENMCDRVDHGRHPAAAKTHCKSGHPFDGDNLVVRPNGGRDCRECHRAASLRYLAKRRAA